VVAIKLQILLPGETAAPARPRARTGAPLSQAAGTAIANGIVVNAVDANWNLIGSATNSVTITTTDTSASIADDNGVASGNLDVGFGHPDLIVPNLQDGWHTNDDRQRRRPDRPPRAPM